MNYNKALENFKLGEIEGESQFSIILIEPKELFLEWLRRCVEARCANSKWLDSAEEFKALTLEMPETNTVWAVPKLESFSSDKEYRTMLSHLKPELAKCEFGKWALNEEHWPKPITEELFDEYFNLSVRERVLDIRNILA